MVKFRYLYAGLKSLLEKIKSFEEQMLNIGPLQDSEKGEVAYI